MDNIPKLTKDTNLCLGGKIFNSGSQWLYPG